MNKLIVLSVGLAVTLCASATTILNFDDIVTGNAVVAMPANYGGISWNSPEYGVYGFADGPYNPHSPPNRVLVNRVTCCPTEEITFSFASPVTFDGAWFAGSATVDFNLYLGGNLVATSGNLTASSTPTFLNSGYAGAVDKVGIFGQRGFYVFDDVTFDSAVPEPGSLALIGTGLFGLAFLARRRYCRS